VICVVERDVVVTREKASHVCGIGGRGTCYVYDGCLPPLADILDMVMNADVFLD